MMEEIFYDIDEIKRNIDMELDELHRLRYNEHYLPLVGKDFMDRLKYWEHAIRRQKDLPYTIVVCGSFKRGKSTFINALLGEDVVSTDVTTETITLNRVSYGEHSNALILDGGKRMLLTDAQLCREELEKVLATLPGDKYQLEIKRPLEILKDVTIVDTPGLDDALKDFEGMVSEALLQADAVVYVFSTTYPLSMQEQMFLRLSVLTQKHTDVFLVSNYADILRDQSEYDRMSQEVRKRCEVILKNHPVHMVSALDERCRQLETERPNANLQDLLAENFECLRQTIHRMLREKSNVVLVDRMERMLQAMRAEMLEHLSSLEYGLSMNYDQVIQERKRLQSEIEAMDRLQYDTMAKLEATFRRMEGETSLWLQELVMEMKDGTGALAGVNTDHIRKYYTLYCIETMQEALSICMEQHMEELFELVEAVSDSLSQRVFRNAENAHVSFRFSINNKTWTKGDNVAFLSNTLLGQNVLTDFLAGTMRQRELKNSAKDLIADIELQYDKLMTSLKPTVAKAYGELKNRMMTEIREYFSDTAERSAAKSEQLIAMTQRSEQEKQESTNAVRMIRSVLENMTI